MHIDIKIDDDNTYIWTIQFLKVFIKQADSSMSGFKARPETFQPITLFIYISMRRRITKITSDLDSENE